MLWKSFSTCLMNLTCMFSECRRKAEYLENKPMWTWGENANSISGGCCQDSKTQFWDLRGRRAQHWSAGLPKMSKYLHQRQKTNKPFLQFEHEHAVVVYSDWIDVEKDLWLPTIVHNVLVSLEVDFSPLILQHGRLLKRLENFQRLDMILTSPFFPTWWNPVTSQ